ncbi:MAG TPA: nitrogenase component 1 [Candidatus Deferrimicrobiaceae bacterium]|jgi:nitrogenase molybdenum-iron protein beta chain
MAHPLYRSRTGCALHGAIRAARAIPGVVPVVHSTAGCSAPREFGSGLPSTGIVEKQVVFGGSSRLREQLKNALKVVSGDLYVVLGGCAPELVGDDIPAMTKEAVEQGYPVICAASAGFRGSAFDGYRLFLKALIENLPDAPSGGNDKIPGLVNLLGIVPGGHATWEGDLAELGRVLERTNLKANPVFGYGGGIDGVRGLARAQRSVVFSPWGLDAARLLEARFGIPWTDAGAIPVGAAETASFLEVLGREAGLGADALEERLSDEARRERHFLDRLPDTTFGYDFQKDFAIVGPGSQALGVARFLTATLGWLPSLVVATDNPPESARQALDRAVSGILPDFGSKLLFCEDAGEIRDAIVDRDVEFVIGSSLEREAANALNIPLLEWSPPVRDGLILETGFAGFRGGLSLVEALSRVILSFDQVDPRARR